MTYYHYEFNLITCLLELKCKLIVNDLSVFEISKDYRYILIDNRVEKVIENKSVFLKEFPGFEDGKFTQDNLLLLFSEHIVILYDLDSQREIYKINHHHQGNLWI